VLWGLKSGELETPLAGLSPAAKACLTAGIPGLAPARWPDASADGWCEIIREGLAPTALKLLEGGGVTPSVHRQMVRVAMLQQVRSLAADALLEWLVDVFGATGTRFVVIKGPAVARLYPGDWPRPYNDIDLLVEPRQFGPVLDWFRKHGFEYPGPSLPPWPWFDAICREGLNLHGAGNVDLHHHLAPWVFGVGLPASDVIARADRVAVRGGPVAEASAEHSAVVAALHILNDLWKGKRGLVSWRDLLVIIHRSGADSVRSAFEESGLGWLFDVAMSTISAEFPGLLQGVDIGASKVPARFSWRMRGLGWGRSSSFSRHRLAWAIRLPSPQAAAFVLGSGLPSRSYIRLRHGSYRRYWRQAWDETVSTFAGADHRSDKRLAGNQDDNGPKCD
jgi:hypothetical protein